MPKGRTPRPPGARESRRGRPPKIEGDKSWLHLATRVPSTPEALRGDALAEWQRLMPYLEALDRMAAVDLYPAVAYCFEWGRFCELMEKELGSHNAKLYEPGRNHEVLHPQLESLLIIAKDILLIAGLFGCTARTRDLEGSHGCRVNSALKRLMGNRRKIAEGKLPQSIVPILPEWTAEDMQPPLWMNDRAYAEFERLGNELKNIDLFTPLDLVPICVMAGLYDLQMRAYEQLRETDLYTYVTAWDKQEQAEVEVMRKAHPLQKGISQIMNIAKLYWSDYGLSPRNRRLFTGEEKREGTEVPLIFQGKFGS